MKIAVKGLIAVGAVAAAALAVALYATRDGGGSGAAYRLQAADIGPVSLTVSSSGNVKPVVTVNVGSQVSGQISELLADFNTEVKAGQVIARLDPATFEAKVQEGRGELAFTKATVAIQKATLEEYKANLSGAQAKLREAERDLARKRELFDRRVVSGSVVDTAVAVQAQAESTLGSLRAKIAGQQAQIESVEAQVVQKAATLRQRELELEHTIIRSPVDGVVISRTVDIGQTVAASLQAPILFTIAQDLSKMQVETSVDEADIGRIREDQQVRFTVDAYPDREFEGTVQQIRKSPLEVSNVITYTVVVSAENPNFALLPGMTANVEIVVGRRDSVLRVPNAALRFAPPGVAPASATATASNGTLSPEERREAARKRTAERLAALDARLALTAKQKEEIAAVFAETGRAAALVSRSGAPEPQVRVAVQKLRADAARRIEALLDQAQRPKFRQMQAESATSPARPGRVWVLGGDGAPRAVDVQTGLSDGGVTEIRRGALKDGDKLIVGLAPAAGSR